MSRVLVLALDQAGALWSLDGKTQHENDDMTLGLAKLRSAVQHVGVVAHPHSAPLIVRLLQMQRIAGWPASVWLGPRSTDDSPCLVPFRLNLPASLGGWRQATWVDQLTYHVIAMTALCGADSPALLLVDPREHPAWPALSFVDQFNPYRGLQLIAAIEDPRWHVDPVAPDSHQRWLAHFGLDPPRGRQPTGQGVSQAQARRAQIIRDAWQGDRAANAPPPAFLAEGVFDDPAADARHASRRFLQLVLEVWLDHLAPPRHYQLQRRRLGRKQFGDVMVATLLPATAGHARQLFVPEHFFADPQQARAWRRHVEAWRRECEAT